MLMGVFLTVVLPKKIKIHIIKLIRAWRYCDTHLQKSRNDIQFKVFFIFYYRCLDGGRDSFLNVNSSSLRPWGFTGLLLWRVPQSTSADR